MSETSENGPGPHAPCESPDEQTPSSKLTSESPRGGGRGLLMRAIWSALPTSLLPKKGSWRGLVFRLALYYVGVVTVLALLQRSLIYHPMREESIQPGDSEFPPEQVAPVRVETDDGLVLNGWHVLCEGCKASSDVHSSGSLDSEQLLVLFFSGNAGNRRYRATEMLISTRAGADVLIVDYRGYGDNAGSPSEEKLAADARSIWKYATQERNVPPENIVLYGESLGGGVAVRLAAEQCESGTPPAGLVIRSSFSSLADAGAYRYPWLPVRTVLLDRFPSVEYMPNVTCPVLQVHGAKDSIVPIRLGRKLFDAAPAESACGIPKRFVELPEAGHNDVLSVAAVELYRAVDRFFGKLKSKSLND